MVFMGDALYSGRSYRLLNVADEGNRGVLAIAADVSLPTARLVAVLDEWCPVMARRARYGAIMSRSSSPKRIGCGATSRVSPSPSSSLVKCSGIPIGEYSYRIFATRCWILGWV